MDFLPPADHRSCPSQPRRPLKNSFRGGNQMEPRLKPRVVQRGYVSFMEGISWYLSRDDLSPIHTQGT